jgi:hypothetical protein
VPFRGKTNGQPKKKTKKIVTSQDGGAEPSSG